MKKTIVLYPGLSVSHIVPMVQLADALLAEGYAVAVALIDLSMDQDVAFAAAVRRVASAKPSVTFHTLPRIKNPPTVTSGPELLLGYLETIRRYNGHLREFLRSSMPPGSVHAVIVDALSMDALDVTKEHGVPCYAFYASNASTLAVFVQLPFIRAEGQPSFRELGDTPLDFHGVPPLPASHLVAEMLEDPESKIYRVMMELMRRNPEADGIFVNTFASLEARAVEALRGRQVLPGTERRLPPVYCVGPLVVGASAESKGKHECLAWLDRQQERSVVFLCFGSIGAASHSEEQLGEIAVGLERSGHRFLWVVRAPLRADPGSHADPDLGALLPDEFLERTRGRGRRWTCSITRPRMRSSRTAAGTRCWRRSRRECRCFAGRCMRNRR